MKNQQPRAKTAAGISSISDKEPSKSDTSFSEMPRQKTTQPWGEASSMLKKAFSLPLAHARGSVTAQESAPAFLNRGCKGAARSLFQHPAS